MGDDEEEQFSVEDIVSFEEQDLREYEQSVQLYVGEAKRLQARELKRLCDDNNIEQTELRGAGPYPQWTKARMIRDLMAHGVALESGEQIDPTLIVPNQWKELLDASNDQDDEPVPSESSNEQEDLGPASAEQLLAMLQQMQTRDLREYEQSVQLYVGECARPGVTMRRSSSRWRTSCPLRNNWSEGRAHAACNRCFR